MIKKRKKAPDALISQEKKVYTQQTFSHQHFECRCENVTLKVGSMENKVSLIEKVNTHSRPQISNIRTVHTSNGPVHNQYSGA